MDPALKELTTYMERQDSTQKQRKTYLHSNIHKNKYTYKYTYE